MIIVYGADDSAHAELSKRKWSWISRIGGFLKDPGSERAIE